MMKALSVAAGLFILLTARALADAAAPVTVIPYLATPLGYQQLTSLSAAAAFTAPSGATYCIFTAESQAVRWRDDGTNPTASVGFPIAVGTNLFYSVKAFPIVFIQESASATVDATCYR